MPGAESRRLFRALVHLQIESPDALRGDQRIVHIDVAALGIGAGRMEGILAFGMLREPIAQFIRTRKPCFGNEDAHPNREGCFVSLMGRG